MIEAEKTGYNWNCWAVAMISWPPSPASTYNFFSGSSVQLLRKAEANKLEVRLHIWLQPMNAEAQ
jgi:hypothetical protein